MPSTKSVAESQNFSRRRTFRECLRGILSAPTFGKGSNWQKIGRILSARCHRVPILSSESRVEHRGFEPRTPLPARHGPGPFSHLNSHASRLHSVLSLPSLYVLCRGD